MGTSAGCSCSTNPQDAVSHGMNIDEYYISRRSHEEVQEWLNNIELGIYFQNFVENGFDKLNFVKNINDKSDLEEIGITKVGHQITIIAAIEKLNTDNNESLFGADASYSDNDNKPLLPTWICKQCGNNNNFKLTKCDQCGEQLLDKVISNQILIKQMIVSPNRAESTWKCNNCYNVNANQESLCLQCGLKQTHDNKQDWIKKGVDV